MNLREQYEVERIIEEIVKENTDKTLDEIKKLVKERLRIKEENGKFRNQVSSKVGIDDIIEVITSRKLLRGKTEANRQNHTRKEVKKNDEQETIR